MRTTVVLIALAYALTAQAGTVSIALDAPRYADQEVVLYRYMDPFTLRLERLAEGHTDGQGQVLLSADVEGTVRAMLRINDATADLYLRAGNYHATLTPPGTESVRMIGGTTKVDLIFQDLPHLDVNALVSDLNGRLDAFLAEDLATDADAGMAAVAKARSGKAAVVPDSIRNRPNLFLSPRWNEARVDTFARKLEKFYAGVNDPWFQSNVEYGLAGLRLGPRTDDRALFNRYLKDRPVLYDVPEYARFFSNFFADYLLRFPFRTNTAQFQREIKNARTDSLKALLGANDFLQDDRLCELVLITGLYAQEANKELDRNGILAILGQVKEQSAFPEHRKIAANMLWDLTAMTAGSILPDAAVLDPAGNQSLLGDHAQGRTCIMVLTLGNAYSEQELTALEQLRKEYGDQVAFICIALDRSPAALATWMRANPKLNWSWFVPVDPRRLMDDLRIRSTPVLYLLDGNRLTASPGPLPSQGLAAILYGIKVKDDAERRLRPDRGVPPPKR
jgi:hypothetical protein